MSKRSAIGVFFFSFFFIWFYQLYWFVQTKKEMTDLGCEIPTSWLMIIPLANFYWEWKYSEAVESVSLGEYSAWMIFLLIQLKWIIVVILVMILIAERDSGNNMTEYFRYIVLASGALSLAILQSIFNTIEKTALFSEDKWKPESQSTLPA